MEKINVKGTTKKLQNLVKKKKTQIIVIKAGSIKTSTHSSGTSSEAYYPSYSND